MSFVLSMLEPILPRQEGLLPYWQLAVAVIAVLNSVQNLATLRLTQRIYNNVPSASVTGLQARTFAAWSLTSAIVRGYAAFNIHDKTIFNMALLTYLIAFAHFTSEILIYRSARLNAGVIMPMLVASSSLVWMITQYDEYVVKTLA